MVVIKNCSSLSLFQLSNPLLGSRLEPSCRRLYNYEGLFTSVRSIDLPLKILAILSVFILLILIAAWIVSSKVCAESQQSVNNKHIPQSGWRATSLLHQFVQAHHQLDEEGEFVGFLSPVHIAHLLVEISLILRCCLLRAIRLLLVVLAMRGDWQCRVREESKQVLTAEFRCSEQATSIPGSFVPPHCLNLRHTDNLPWTKALVNEIVRFSAAGFPMFALREAPRDGHLSDYDYAEGELILLNQLVYLNDRDVWERDIFTQADDEEKRTSEANAVPNRGQIQDNELIFPGLPFSPYRFLQKCDPESADKQLRLELPGHWVRHMLAGYTVCVPNYSIYRLLTAIVVHIFGTGLHVTVEKNFLPAYSEAGDDSSLRIPRDLPPVCFTSSQ
ncbi:hypothetical protein FGIG_12197 [Fasciola gigantica]|uniref:Uncharacterized protein n=1 Tax=Fasciola gigantica TaxID=46835 RepID=A0A504YR54_FASGI|nr:hypothetical protein FGIG_12197 [Fasciola gigantica]